MNFDSLTKFEHLGLFTLHDLGIYPAEDYGKDLIFHVRVEMNQDLIELKR